MKKDHHSDRTRFNLFLTNGQAQSLWRLLDVGLTMSAIARQSIRKCSEMQLLPDTDGPFPIRFNFYVDHSDVESLSLIALRENSSRAAILRRLIDTYLSEPENAAAIDRLF